MPASGGDPVANALRGGFSSGSRLGDLDQNLETSAKRVLVSHIEFEPAPNYHSDVLSSLKAKCIVINTKPTSSKIVNGSNGVCKKQGAKLPSPKVVLFPLENVRLGFRTNVPVGSGMSNLGNTCYLNSTLQALFHVPSFVNYLVSEQPHVKCEQYSEIQLHPDDILCAVVKTLKCAMAKTGSTMKPICIYSKLKAICKHLSQGSQEDAHEFMRYLLESLEKNYIQKNHRHHNLDAWSKETTPINQIFGGYIRNEVTCLSCRAVSTTFQHFQDLPLDIRRVSTLNDALASYFERERLPEGEDAYKCEKCNQKVAATKKFSIERPPNVLSVQLKRFSSMNGKLTKQVALAQDMDLTRFVSNSVQFKSPVKYRLVSMVTHMGQSANCGHYTAIAQAANGHYYEFDDAQVRQVSTNIVLNTNTYLVFYELEKPFTLNTRSHSETSSASDLQGKTNGPIPTGPVRAPTSTMVRPTSVSPIASPRPLTTLTTARQAALPVTGPSTSTQNIAPATSTSLVPYESDVDSDVENKESDTAPGGWKVTPVKSRPAVPSPPVRPSSWLVTDVEPKARKENGLSKPSATEPSAANGTSPDKNRLSTNSNPSNASATQPEKNSDASDARTTSADSVAMTIASSSEKHAPSSPIRKIGIERTNGFQIRSTNQVSRNGEGRRSMEANGRISNEDSRTERSSEQQSHVVKKLLTNSHRGYGNGHVKSWNGNMSEMGREVEDERREARKRSADELYNSEIDRGKNKRSRGQDRRRDDRRGINLFQQRSNMNNSWRGGGGGRFDYKHQRQQHYRGGNWNYRRNNHYQHYNNYNSRY